MPGAVGGKRRATRFVIVAALLVLVGGAIGLWTAWIRPFPDPLAQGRDAYHRGEWSTAAESARQVLKARELDPAALRLLARSSIRMGRDDLALAIYTRRLGAEAIEAEDDLLRGIALDRRGQPDEALLAWEKALEADRVSPEILEELIHLFSEQGGRPRALEHLQRHPIDQAAQAAERLRRQPGWESRGDLMLGSIRIAQNDIAAATESFRRVMRRDPRELDNTREPTQFRKSIARTFLRAGRPTEGREVLESIPAHQADREVSWLLSRAFLQEGDNARARAMIARAGAYRKDHLLEEEPGPYVGEARCQPCHPSVFQDSLASRHTRTYYRGEQLRSLPRPDRPLPDPTDPGVTHTIQETDGRLCEETRVGERVFRAVIEYAFGSSDRYLTMVGRDANERHRILRLSYYQTAAGKGWDRTLLNLEEPAHAEDFRGRPISVCDDVIKCLYCHVTFPRAGRERIGPETADRAIGCERCHGPGAHHLAAIAAGLPDLAIVSPADASPRAVSERQCNDCHILDRSYARRDDRENPYWIRSQGAGWAWSRCNTESGGAFGCVTCHDPHRDARSTSTAEYEAKCLACHSAATAPLPGKPAPGPRSETGPGARACPVNSTKGCIACHMPVERNEASHLDLSDHYIRIRRP